MKRHYKLLITILCLVSILSIVVYADADLGFDFTAGTLLGEYLTNSGTTTRSNVPNDAVASYHGEYITDAQVAYQREMGQLTSGAVMSDTEIIEDLVMGFMMKEEAARLEVTATQEEIDAMMDSQRANYDHPDIKPMIDEYCEGAGITVEEYYQIIAEEIPGVITKQKLRDEIGRQYCEEHGIEFTKINPPQEMVDAIDDYIQELFEQNKQDIVYYTDG